MSQDERAAQLTAEVHLVAQRLSAACNPRGGMNASEINQVIEEDFTNLSRHLHEAKCRFPEHKELKEDLQSQLAMHTFSVFRSAHTLSHRKWAMKDKQEKHIRNFEIAHKNLEALVADITTSKSYIDIPNSLCWMLVKEFFFIFECDCNTSGIEEFKVPKVIEFLQRIVSMPDCDALTALREKGPAPFLNNSPSDSPHNMRPKYVLGLFAQITLVRVYVALGDYRSAIRTAEPLLIFTKTHSLLPHLFAAANINLYYHVGFAYMMLRRYSDAARAFQYALPTSAKDYDEKMRHKAATLLSVCSVLGGLNIPVTTSVPPKIQSTIEDNESALRKADVDRKADMDKIGILFKYNSPKFLPCIPESKSTSERPKANDIIMEQQQVVFLRQVEQQLRALQVQGHFKAYKTLSIEKAGAMLKENSRLEAMSRLIAAKLNSFERVVEDSNKGGLLSEERVVSGEVKFRIESDNVSTSNKQNSTVAAMVKRIAELHSA